MKGKIVIAGGTGFLGNYLHEKFTALGYHVEIISRSNGISWDDTTKLTETINGSLAVINLAGKSVNCRYTESNKQEILGSRIRTTKRMGEIIAACDKPPEVWFNSSTATIHRDEQERANNEYDGIAGDGFSVNVAKQWEATFNSFDLPHTRRIAMRISIVLGKDGGVFPVYKNLVRFGLGGRQGSGKQMFSWIHIEDVFRIILFTLENKNFSGPVNMAAPHPVDNTELMRLLRKAFHMPIGLPSFTWMLKIGAFVIGTETELILKSRWVKSKKLEEQQFQFSFPTLEKALAELTT
ncbi:MAG: TIGR01777 family protein [Flavobacteriales bacterium]|nr:TIGR01777 family protein [Flavobacteriales bacterium]